MFLFGTVISRQLGAFSGAFSSEAREPNFVPFYLGKSGSKGKFFFSYFAVELQIDEREEELSSSVDHPVRTEYFEWCCSYFAQSVMRVPERDPESESHQEHEFQLVRAARVKRAALEEQARAGCCLFLSRFRKKRCKFKMLISTRCCSFFLC